MAQIDIERTVAASPRTVWEAWTRYPDISFWWWPLTFMTRYEIDTRVGGTYRFRANNVPEVGTLGLSGEFLEVDAQRRLLYTWRWDSSPLHETRVEVVFAADGDATRIRLRHEGLKDEVEASNHRQGWNDCLDRLQELLERDNYAPGRWFNIGWDIRREGRAWTHDEFLPRLDLAPEKMEAIDGKLFWDDNQRMVMLGLMLENLGVDAALRLGDLRVWKQAIADLERNGTDSSLALPAEKMVE